MNLDRPMGRRREHLLFGGALLCLVILASWWIAFMTRSVQLEYDYALVEIRAEAAELAHQLESPELSHTSLQVVVEEEASNWSISLSNVPGYAIDLRPDRIQTLDDTLSRRRLMVLGEGGLLLGLLGVCIFMLIRLVATRSSVQREMELFVGQMTHEMKTPLAGLRALLETIQRGRLDGPGIARSFGVGFAASGTRRTSGPDPTACATLACDAPYHGNRPGRHGTVDSWIHRESFCGPAGRSRPI